MYCFCALKLNLCPLSENCSFPGNLSLLSYNGPGNNFKQLTRLPPVALFCSCVKARSGLKGIMAETVSTTHVHAFLILLQHRKPRQLPGRSPNTLSERKLWQERDFLTALKDNLLRGWEFILGNESPVFLQPFYSLCQTL